MATIPDLIPSQFANGGDRAIPPQTDPLGFVNFTNGYTTDYEIDLSSGNANAKAVERTIQNYMFFLLTGIGKAWQEKSVAPWYGGIAYEKGAYVGRVTGGGVWQVYRALIASTNVDPNSVNSSWEYVPFVFETMKSVAMPAGGSATIIPGGQTTELITATTDFNTLTNGIWEYQTDALANGSPHAPAQLGAATSFAGTLEAKQWLNGATAYNIQRYSDRTGVVFYRGATGGVWTAWTSNVSVSDYSLDTGSANAVQGNALLASSSIVDNQKFWVQIAALNTGATTFSPSPGITARAVVGMGLSALQGGELPVGGRALFIYDLANTRWILVECSGGAQQIASATKTNQAMNLGQAIGRLIGVQVFLAGGTYTPTPGTASVIVEAVGGGGGSGGVPATSASQQATAPGGISGGFIRARINSGFSGVTVSIGAAGTLGGPSTSGGAGGNTTFGALVTAPGGLGGSPGSATGATAVIFPSSISPTDPSTTGTLLDSIRGASGNGASVLSLSQVIGGTGGDSPWGRGGRPVTGQPGNPGTGFGSGGSGASGVPSQGGANGAAGTPGRLVVYEYGSA